MGVRDVLRFTVGNVVGLHRAVKTIAFGLRAFPGVFASLIQVASLSGRRGQVHIRSLKSAKIRFVPFPSSSETLSARNRDVSGLTWLSPPWTWLSQRRT